VPPPPPGKLGLIQPDHAVALSLSMTHKAVGFDRPMPEADFDTLDLPPTGTQPTGIPGATRHGGARNRQAPRQPIRRDQHWQEVNYKDPTCQRCPSVFERPR
jgi:hypothetical protein